MILCAKNCYPCCDFCIHVEHEIFEVKDINGIKRRIRGAPIKCLRFHDEIHDDLALNSSFCNEFHCATARWPELWVNISEEDWVHENM